MGWPFTSAPAPTFDTGIAAPANGAPTAVPLVGGGTLGAAAAIWLMCLSLDNTSSADITVTVTDGSGANVWTVDVPAKDTVEREFPFRPLTGLKWGMTVASGVNAQAWGYM